MKVTGMKPTRVVVKFICRINKIKAVILLILLKETQSTTSHTVRFHKEIITVAKCSRSSFNLQSNITRNIIDFHTKFFRKALSAPFTLRQYLPIVSLMCGQLSKLCLNGQVTCVTFSTFTQQSSVLEGLRCGQLRYLCQKGQVTCCILYIHVTVFNNNRAIVCLSDLPK